MLAEMVIKLRILLHCSVLTLVLTGCTATGDAGWVSQRAGQSGALAYGREVQLAGMLRREILPGPPNYEAGVGITEYWILQLRHPLAVAADPRCELNVAEQDVTDVQLLLDDDAKCRELLNQVVQVKGTLLHRATDHHRTAVLIEVQAMQQYQQGEPRNSGGRVLE